MSLSQYVKILYYSRTWLGKSEKRPNHDISARYRHPSAHPSGERIIADQFHGGEEKWRKAWWHTWERPLKKRDNLKIEKKICSALISTNFNSHLLSLDQQHPLYLNVSCLRQYGSPFGSNQSPPNFGRPKWLRSSTRCLWWNVCAIGTRGWIWCAVHGKSLDGVTWY